MADEQQKSTTKVKSIRDRIWDAQDIPEETIDVEQWGVKVLIKGMDGKSRADFLKNASGKDGGIAYDRFYAELLIATVFDPDTEERVFEGADREAINRKSGAALEKVAEVSQRLSGLGTADVDEAKKDSAETENSDST